MDAETKKNLLSIAENLKNNNIEITMLSIKNFAKDNNIDVANIKFGTTYSLLKKYGYSFKKGNDRSVERRMEMAKLTHQGLTLQQIGDKYGITRQAVSLVLQKAAKEGAIVLKSKGTNKNPEKNVIIISRSIAKFFDCIVCGKNFKSKTTKKTCSKLCFDKLIQNRTGGKWSRYETVELNCATCNKNFKRTKYLFQITTKNKKGSKYYCSRKCYTQKSQCREINSGN